MRQVVLMLWTLSLSCGISRAGLPTQTPGDWTEVADQARAAGLPIMLLIDSPDCGYCELLKREILIPLHKEGRLHQQAIVTNLDLNSRGKLVDFDGERVRSRLFLKRYKIFATPTVLFLDQDGRLLQDPLVGYNGVDLYTPLLERAMEQSIAAMEQITGEKGRKLAKKAKSETALDHRTIR